MQIIPNHAKKVFKGTVFDIYQWKQKMFNGEYVIFERAQTLDGGSVIATVGDKIILLKQKQPRTGWYYSLPGGYFDYPGENPKDGVMRELLEETGYRPKSAKLWKVFPSGGRVNCSHYLYIARNCEKIAEQRVDGGEIIQQKLVTFEQFLKMGNHPDMHHRNLVIELLKAQLSAKRKAAFKKLLFG